MQELPKGGHIICLISQKCVHLNKENCFAVCLLCLYHYIILRRVSTLIQHANYLVQPYRYGHNVQTILHHTVLQTTWLHSSSFASAGSVPLSLMSDGLLLVRACRSSACLCYSECSFLFSKLSGIVTSCL